ncbi:uncharacterized protein LOC125226477 [Leguminivora glycinivorella]|uniref:uncharacterized protein LOC125226477 n=1 Tax=Leguminivora glycinivorella TaxID=1035111 RepID=UPI00200F88D8|nr:uncharacterized protein LOC125226477 [Leguminivora glycinivorella]
MKMVNRILRIVLLFFPTIVECSNLEARDEKTYPNGTLVGTYQYVDAHGNQVRVKYFADGNSYSIDLRGYKIPEKAENATQNITSSVANATEVIDTLVPLKLDFPVVDNIYTIETAQNYSNDIPNTNQENHGADESNDEKEGGEDDYDDYNSVLKIPKVKIYDKAQEMKKAVRKIRQTLDIFMRKIPKSNTT